MEESGRSGGPDGSQEQAEEELSIPRAALNKYIREICPNIRVGLDTRDLLLQCCSDFIHAVSAEANAICNDTQKKTITADHILKALTRMGFEDYIGEAETVLRDCKAVAAKKRRKGSRLENLGIPEEELMRQQQELFAKARQEMEEKEGQRLLALQHQHVVTLPPPDDLSDSEEELDVD